MEFGGTVDRPFAGANRARLCIGGKDHPVRLPDAVTRPGRGIAAGEVNQDLPAGGSGAEPLRFPFALGIIDDLDLLPEFTEHPGQTLGEPGIRQRLREGYDRDGVDRLPQQAGARPLLQSRGQQPHHKKAELRVRVHQ